jgi:hypothetical protein
MTTPTAEEVRGMGAGREMDALVAEYVMGWRWWRIEHKHGPYYRLVSRREEERALNLGSLVHPLPDDGLDREVDADPYSTDIAAAWEVVEKMAEREPVVTIRKGKWRCAMLADGIHEEVDVDAREVVYAQNYVASSKCETAPLAIARCALLTALASQQQPPTRAEGGGEC